MKNFILKLINNVKDETYLYDDNDIRSGKDMGVLCYIVPFIPYFLNKNNKFVRYHSINGMNLFIIAVFYYLFFNVVSKINISILQIILSIVWLMLLILSCIGISNVCSGKARGLPIINKIKIFK